MQKYVIAIFQHSNNIKSYNNRIKKKKQLIKRKLIFEKVQIKLELKSID